MLKAWRFSGDGTGIDGIGCWESLWRSSDSDDGSAAVWLITFRVMGLVADMGWRTPEVCLHRSVGS